MKTCDRCSKTGPHVCSGFEHISEVLPRIDPNTPDGARFWAFPQARELRLEAVMRQQITTLRALADEMERALSQ